MTPSNQPSKLSPEELSRFVEQAERFWEAECNNADRLSTDTRVTLSLNSAVLSVIAIGLVRAPYDAWQATVPLWLALALAAIGAFLASFVHNQPSAQGVTLRKTLIVVSLIGAVAALVVGMVGDVQIAMKWLLLIAIHLLLLFFTASIIVLLVRLRLSAPSDEATEDAAESAAAPTPSEVSAGDQKHWETRAAVAIADRHTSVLPPTASWLLAPPDAATTLLEENGDASAVMAHSRLLTAAHDLFDRNYRFRADIRMSRLLFADALIVTLVAALLFVWAQALESAPQRSEEGSGQSTGEVDQRRDDERSSSEPPISSRDSPHAPADFSAGSPSS